jgi:hypothetical protein
MKRSRFTLMVIVFGLMFGDARTASTNPKSQQLVILSSEVGPGVNETENERYHLFSRDVGLISAHVYTSASKEFFRLHVTGEKDGRPWFLIRELNGIQKNSLVKRILQATKSPLSSFGQPVIKIELPGQIGSDDPLNVMLIDGTEIIGRIRSCSADTVRFVTLSGINIDIPENQISEARWPEGQMTDTGFLRYDPTHHRLFFGPTGRTLRQGQINFSDFYIFFPSGATGITDMVMLGGGMSLIPGASTQLFYVAPKVRFFHNDRIDWSVGMLYMTVPGELSGGVGYTALSVGSPLSGITLGAAVPLFVDENEGLENLALLLGLETQVSDRLKLLSENWLFTAGTTEESFLLLSGGFRFIGERLTVDLAFFTSPDFFDEGIPFPFIPYVAFSMNFGK